MTKTVIVHNAGHMVLGPAESFTPEQLAQVYDTNVLSTQRVNRAVLPSMRARRDGLLVWVGSSSTYGGTPPYLAPYFGAKAAMDHLAKSYAVELGRFGIAPVPRHDRPGQRRLREGQQPRRQDPHRLLPEDRPHRPAHRPGLRVSFPLRCTASR